MLYLGHPSAVDSQRTLNWEKVLKKRPPPQQKDQEKNEIIKKWIKFLKNYA